MKDPIYKIFAVYLLMIFLTLVTSSAFGQVKAVLFNAEWNQSNDVDWFKGLSDVAKSKMDISVGDCQSKYEIAIIPTIVIFDDGEEVKRFQADLSFKLLATKEDVQEYIDELIISKF